MYRIFVLDFYKFLVCVALAVARTRDDLRRSMWSQWIAKSTGANQTIEKKEKKKICANNENMKKKKKKKTLCANITEAFRVIFVLPISKLSAAQRAGERGNGMYYITLKPNALVTPFRIFFLVRAAENKKIFSKQGIPLLCSAHRFYRFVVVNMINRAASVCRMLFTKLKINYLVLLPRNWKIRYSIRWNYVHTFFGFAVNPMRCRHQRCHVPVVRARQQEIVSNLKANVTKYCVQNCFSFVRFFLLLIFIVSFAFALTAHTKRCATTNAMANVCAA